LIAGIFGMNVPFPYQESEWSTWAIIVLLVAIMVGMLVFFWRRRWL
jgi:magnesium transporter